MKSGGKGHKLYDFTLMWDVKQEGNMQTKQQTQTPTRERCLPGRGEGIGGRTNRVKMAKRQVTERERPSGREHAILNIDAVL